MTPSHPLGIISSMNTTRTAFLAVLCLTLSLTLAADEKPAGPKSPAATAAIAKHAKALDEASRVYQVAKQKADGDLVTELKAAQAAAMQAKNLQEANAIQGAIDKAAAAKPAADDLVQKITSKKWAFRGTKTVVTYNANGSAECSGWGGKPGTWTRTGPNTITQHEPGGSVINITFDPECRGAVWVYQNGGEVAYSVAQ